MWVIKQKVSETNFYFTSAGTWTANIKAAKVYDDFGAAVKKMHQLDDDTGYTMPMAVSELKKHGPGLGRVDPEETKVSDYDRAMRGI